MSPGCHKEAAITRSRLQTQLLANCLMDRIVAFSSFKALVRHADLEAGGRSASDRSPQDACKNWFRSSDGQEERKRELDEREAGRQLRVLRILCSFFAHDPVC